jgi:hypothetical protein
MKRLIVGTFAFLLTIGMMPAQAQDGPPQFRPLEVWACSFNDGMDQDDMDDVYEEIVEASGDTAYSAFQLTPYFRGTFGPNIDFVYLGAWADGSVMGADMASYLGTPDESWDDTVTCQGFLYASNWVQPIQPPEDSGTGVVTVSDCTIDHGSTPAQAVGAISRFNNYRVANGMTIGTLVWFPVYGANDAEFDFKLVSVYSDAQHMGDAFKWSVDNAAYNVSASMTAGLVSCDEARLYTARTIMNNIPPPQ